MSTIAKSLVGRRGIPNMKVARLRAATIPASVRRTGLSDAYLRPLDNGHVRPVARFARGQNWASNQRWEFAAWNRATGVGRKPYGYWIRTNRALRAHAWRTLARGGAVAALKGAALAALWEAPIATLEEVVSVRRGEKGTRQGAVDASTKIGVAAAGGFVGTGIAFGVVAVGAGTLLFPVGIAGAVVVTATTAGRVRKMLKPSRIAARRIAASRRNLRDYSRKSGSKRPSRNRTPAPSQRIQCGHRRNRFRDI